MYKDKEKEAKFFAQYRIKNKDRIAQRSKEYRAKHRDKLLAYQKQHYRNNKEMYKKSMSEWRKCNKKQYLKALKSWEGLIPFESKCEICGKITYYNKQNTQEATHFDHRNEGNEAIKGCPSRWLRDRKRTSESEKIWLSCDFGKLCYTCNRFLPTKGRKLFLKQAIKYVFGKDMEI